MQLKALYGSPFLDFSGQQHEKRYRHKFDPVSFIESGSKTVGLRLVNPFDAHYTITIKLHSI